MIKITNTLRVSATPNVTGASSHRVRQSVPGSWLLALAALGVALGCSYTNRDPYPRDASRAASQPVAKVPAATAPVANPTPRPTLVIICTSPLRAAAEAWAAYRQSEAGGSWNTILHVVDATQNAEAQAAATNSVLAAISSRSESAQGTHILLLGDATEDPAAPGLATTHVSQTDPQLLSGDDDRQFATDQHYQLADASGVPRFPLGRVPARTPQEAQAVLSKIKAYESRVDDGRHAIIGRNRITYVAGEARFGVMDGLLETLFKQMVDRFVPDAFDLSMTYVKPTSIYCPPPSKLTETVLQRMGEGCLLFNYVGHGHPTGLDSMHWGEKRLPILRTTDLANLARFSDDGTQRPIAFMSCCSTGFFDLPNGKRSLAEEMLFAPDGPIAVIAASRVSHPYANTVLQMDITRALLTDRAPTAGMLDLLAARALIAADSPFDRELDAIAGPIAMAGKWKTSLADLRKMHAAMYNLLGDPATRLTLPDVAITDIVMADGKMTAAVPGMKSGKATITLETERTGMAQPGGIQPVTADNDPALEAKAGNNYPLANKRVLLTLDADVKDGRVELAMPLPLLPEGAAVARFVAVGRDIHLRPMSAIGAFRFPASATRPASRPAGSEH